MLITLKNPWYIIQIAYSIPLLVHNKLLIPTTAIHNIADSIKSSNITKNWQIILKLVIILVDSAIIKEQKFGYSFIYVHFICSYFCLLWVNRQGIGFVNPLFSCKLLIFVEDRGIKGVIVLIVWFCYGYKMVVTGIHTEQEVISICACVLYLY